MKYKNYEIDHEDVSLLATYENTIEGKKILLNEVSKYIARDLLVSLSPRGFYKGWGKLRCTWTDDIKKNGKWNKLYIVEMYHVMGDAMENLGLHDMYYSDDMRFNYEHPFCDYVIGGFCRKNPKTAKHRFLTREQFDAIEIECAKIIRKLLTKNCFVRK